MKDITLAKAEDMRMIATHPVDLLEHIGNEILAAAKMGRTSLRYTDRISEVAPCVAEKLQAYNYTVRIRRDGDHVGVVTLEIEW